MYRYCTYILLVMSCLVVIAGRSEALAHDDNASSITVMATKYAKMEIVVGIVSHNDVIANIARTVKKDLEFQGQCSVKIIQFPKTPSKKMVKELFKQGHPLVVFIDETGSDALHWHVYQTCDATLAKKNVLKKRGEAVRGWAHNLSDELWLALTNTPGFFSTKIAYCKMVTRPGKSCIKQVCIADYDGSHEELVVDSPSIQLAPRWGYDLTKPMLFYSECTQTNIRLMVTDLHKHRRVVSSFDGLNMLPSFARGGDEVVYCLSRGSGCCQLYHYCKGELKNLTNNYANNLSPSFAPSGKVIYFCSDLRAGFPELYSYTMETKQLERLSTGDYCIGPTYCEATGKVAYSRTVQGTLQIFIYDVATKTHEQITFNSGNKQECSWSPCGQHVLYAVSSDGKSSLAMIHCATKVVRGISSSSSNCTYPSWSPLYKEFPVMAEQVLRA